VKILLLNPPMNYGAYNEAGRIYLDQSYPPLGLAYVAAVLEKQKYNVKVFDFVDTPFENVEKIIRTEKPQIVGISCNLTDYRWASFELARIIKEIDPEIKVIMGGSHATHMYEQILANFPVDVIVRFEGELTFLDLVKSIEASSDLRNVKGIAFRNNDRIIKNEDRPPITDLDSIPFPAYHFFNFEKYVHYSSPARFNGKKVSELKSSNLMASRGCPFNCKYCSVTKYWRGHCRLRSARNVVDEMEMLHEEYGVTHFNFFDDVFTLNSERVIEICKEIIRRKLNVCWECVTRVDFISMEMLRWMKRGGCLSISYGVESGSPTVLQAIDKRQTRDQIVRAFQITHDVGIFAYILLMIGNPHESDQSIDETIELLRIVKPDKIRTTLTMVYPATDLYEICKEKGLINDEYWLTEKAAQIFTAENTVRQLRKWESRVSFSYYMQRRKILRLFEIMLYRMIFRNLRELTRQIIPKVDKYMEKIDHVLHSA
jgi:anaerobic magnesium-protoporphyrin IX monomethyl ester cyclase